MNGLLYVVGGDDGTANLASVEYYNPRNNEWKRLTTSMTTGRSYSGIAVIDKIKVWVTSKEESPATRGVTTSLL